MGAKFGKNVYDGEAGFGKFQSTVGAFLGTVVAVIFLVVGILFLKPTKKKNLVTTNAIVDTIESNNCQAPDAFNDNEGTCSYNIRFDYSGSTGIGTIGKCGDPNIRCGKLTISDNIKYSVGQLIKIQYDPTDSTVFQPYAAPRSTITIGIIFVVCSILLVIGSWLTYYAAHKYQTAAVALGAASTLDILSKPFRR
jgi:preprotein translocase subunit SecG